MVELHDDQGNEPADGIEFTTPPATELSPRATEPAGNRQQAGPSQPPRTENPLTPPAKVPLDANAIKFPILSISRAAAEWTGYDPYAFTAEESEVLSQAIAALGAEVPAFLNVVLLGVGIIGGKVAGHAIWVKAGKPAPGTSRRRNAHTEPAEDAPEEPPAGEIAFDTVGE